MASSAGSLATTLSERGSSSISNKGHLPISPSFSLNEPPPPNVDENEEGASNRIFIVSSEEEEGEAAEKEDEAPESQQQQKTTNDEQQKTTNDEQQKTTNDDSSVVSSSIREREETIKTELTKKMKNLGVTNGGGEDEEEDEFQDAREDVSPTHRQLEIVQDADVIHDQKWKNKRKHIFILSEAGKPIYSRYGDEDSLASLMAVIQAHISFVQDLGDTLRAIEFEECTIVFMHKGPLILVGVTRGSESITQIMVQLTYMYNQILSVLTQTQLLKIFEQKKGYDLRRMLGGSERLLDHLATAMDYDPSFMLSSVRVLPLSPPVRDSISNTITSHLSKIKDVVFAILIAENHLITLVRMKKYFIHPADLHLIFNMVNSSESFKHSESWTPICLPKFDSSGFLHAHVSYLRDDVSACLLMLTVERDIFYTLSEAKQKIVASLEKLGSLKAIKEGLKNSSFSPKDVGVPEIRHFLYKAKTSAQFTCPSFVHPYGEIEEQLRLHSLYLFLQHRLHSPTRPLKLIYYSGQLENIIGWVTQSFELYATFDPLSTKVSAIGAVNKLLRWIKKDENSLFILSAPTF